MIRAYSLPIFVRQTAATVAGKAVWAFRNKGKSPLYIRQINWSAMFDGTAAASQSVYFLEHISVADFSGGTAMTPAPKNPTEAGVAAPASMVSLAQFLDTGLTDAGVTYGNPLACIGSSRQLSAAVGGYAEYDTWVGRRQDSIIVPPLFGLAIVLGAVAVIGDGLKGWIEWEEESLGA